MRIRSLLNLVTSSVIALLLAYSLPAFAAPVSQSELSVAQKMDPRIFARLAQAAVTNPDGATGNNRSGFLQVGLQGNAIYVATNAMLSQNPSEVDRALKILEYGFAHEHPDGSFDYRTSNGVVNSGDPGGPINQAGNTAFFLADVGRTLNLLRSSQWFLTSPSLANARGRVTRMYALSGPALNHLASVLPYLMADKGASNREFTYAVAFYTLGSALHDAQAIRSAYQLLDQTLSNQTPDGVFPESGGFDSSYQGVSLYMAQTLFLAMSPTDSRREHLWSAIQKGMTRETSSINPDGSVSTSGNTRVSAHGEKTFGQTKHVDMTSMTLALNYYGILSGNRSVLDLASAVAKRGHITAP